MFSLTTGDICFGILSAWFLGTVAIWMHQKYKKILHQYNEFHKNIIILSSNINSIVQMLESARASHKCRNNYSMHGQIPNCYFRNFPMFIHILYTYKNNDVLGCRFFVYKRMPLQWQREQKLGL